MHFINGDAFNEKAVAAHRRFYILNAGFPKILEFEFYLSDILNTDQEIRIKDLPGIIL